MGDLTKNISRHELTCKCGACEFTVLDHEEVIQIVQGACDYFSEQYQVDRVKLVITSAARCTNHNKSIGSTDNSMHARACAIDHQIFAGNVQVSTKEVAKYYDTHFSNRLGIGTYDSFVHVDNRSIKARW